MKGFTQVVVVSFIATMLYVPGLYAALIEAEVGDHVITTFGPNQTGNGGEFLITDNEDSKDYRYISFCLETDEHLNVEPPYNNYIIESIGDFAVEGGVAFTPDGYSSATEDYLSDAIPILCR